MPEVRIDHSTSLSKQEVRDRVDGVMAKIEERFGISGSWNGDTYKFKRSGVDGVAEIADGKVTVVMKLGLLLGAFRGKIENELRSKLEERLP